MIYLFAKLFLAKCFVRANSPNFTPAKLSRYTVYTFVELTAAAASEADTVWRSSLKWKSSLSAAYTALGIAPDRKASAKMPHKIAFCDKKCCDSYTVVIYIP